MSKTIGHNVNRNKEYFSVTGKWFLYGCNPPQKRFLKKSLIKLDRLDGKKIIQAKVLELAKEARKEEERLHKEAEDLFERFRLQAVKETAVFEYRAYLAEGDCNQERIYCGPYIPPEMNGHRHYGDHCVRWLWEDHEFDKSWDDFTGEIMLCCEIKAYENSAESEEPEIVSVPENRRKNRKTIRGY